MRRPSHGTAAPPSMKGEPVRPGELRRLQVRAVRPDQVAGQGGGLPAQPAQRPVGAGIGLTVNAVTPGYIATDMVATPPLGSGSPRRSPSGLLPGGRPVRLHHRADLGRQRRHGHVSGGAVDTSQREVFVLSATRTAIGKYGGGLAAVPPCDLAATVVREAAPPERYWPSRRYTSCTAPRPLRPGHHVHRRRPGHRRHLRARLARLKARGWASGFPGALLVGRQGPDQARLTNTSLCLV